MGPLQRIHVMSLSNKTRLPPIGDARSTYALRPTRGRSTYALWHTRGRATWPVSVLVSYVVRVRMFTQTDTSPTKRRIQSSLRYRAPRHPGITSYNQPTERTGHLVPCERGANSHLHTQGRLVHVSSTLSILPTKVGSTLSILQYMCARQLK